MKPTITSLFEALRGTLWIPLLHGNNIQVVLRGIEVNIHNLPWNFLPYYVTVEAILLIVNNHTKWAKKNMSYILSLLQETLFHPIMDVIPSSIHNIALSNERCSIAMPSYSVWSIGIPESRGFTFESIAGPTNTTHQLSTIMSNGTKTCKYIVLMLPIVTKLYYILRKPTMNICK